MHDIRLAADQWAVPAAEIVLPGQDSSTLPGIPELRLPEPEPTLADDERFTFDMPAAPAMTGRRRSGGRGP